MKEPINFDKVENQALLMFVPPYRSYKISKCERVGIGARKFWVTPDDMGSNGLQFVIYWQSNPMVEAIDTVEVELYKNGPGMFHSGKKRYNIKRADIRTILDFTQWVKIVIQDFEPELSTPL